MSLAVDPSPRATFILPVFNAEEFLAHTLSEVHAWLAGRPERWELLIVDDASTDASGRIVEEFVRDHPGEAVQRVRFLANRGKGFAVRAGIELARGRHVVFTDCDLAYALDNVATILERLDSGADAAIACRVLPESRYVMSPSFFSYLYTRHLMGRAFNRLCRVLTVPRLLDTQAGLKGFRTDAVRPVISRMVLNGFSFDVELLRALMDNGAKIAEVPVSFRYDSEPSTVAFLGDSLRMLRDLVRVRVRSMAGIYRSRTPDDRPASLVIHADDYGLSPGVNRAIEQNLLAGSVTSTSLLVGSPHSAEAIAWAARHPRFDYGVHLNLTLGRPVLPPEQVPSLVDREGRFLTLRRFFTRLALGRVRSSEILAEWTAQVDVVRRAGVRITHLDSHQHVHLAFPLFSRAMAPLAERLGVSVRTMDGPLRARGCRPDLKGLLLALATRMSVRGKARRLSAARGSGTAFMRRPSLDVLGGLVSRMTPGRAYELVVHPGFVDAALTDSGDAYLLGREVEREILGSDEVRALLRRHTLRLVDFKGTDSLSLRE